MEEDYCSFELAKKLFEKGMPQELDSYYGYAIRECYSSFDYYSPKYNVGDEVVLDDGFSKEDVIIAPTLALVQKWLRREKQIYLQINPVYTCTNIMVGWTFDFNGLKKDNDRILISYEEALEAGINKALELI